MRTSISLVVLLAALALSQSLNKAKFPKPGSAVKFTGKTPHPGDDWTVDIRASGDFSQDNDFGLTFLYKCGRPPGELGSFKSEVCKGLTKPVVNKCSDNDKDPFIDGSAKVCSAAEKSGAKIFVPGGYRGGPESTVWHDSCVWLGEHCQDWVDAVAFILGGSKHFDGDRKEYSIDADVDSEGAVRLYEASEPPPVDITIAPAPPRRRFRA